MHYEIKTRQFEGPLEKLLELIEQKKLEITQLSLAEVTADFLEYVRNLGEKTDAKTLADFLVIASYLVLIKSKALLPALQLTEKEEEEIYDLEMRLKLYKEFKRAGEYINAYWNKRQIAFSRPLLYGVVTGDVFYPPAKLSKNDLFEAMLALSRSLKELLPEAQKKVKQAVISLEHKMKELMERFYHAAEHSFSALSQAKSKSEVIVLFLAILHLLKDKLLEAEQEKQFGDIVLKKPRD